MSVPDNRNLKWSSQLVGHPFVWLAVTVLVVLIAYAWMSQTKKELDVVSVRKLTPETATVDIQKAEKLIKQETMAITDDMDAVRKQEYLKEEFFEQNISPLLKSASNNSKLGQISLPKGENAWEDYQKILEIQPDNENAQAGIVRLKNLLIDNAQTSIESGDYEGAENWIIQLDIMQPGDSLQIDLRSDIKTQIALEAKAKLEEQKEQERLLKVENSLSQAQQEEDNFPLNYNKIKDLYNRVLELDPENSSAKAGIEKLVDGLLDESEKQLRNDNLISSQSYLNQAKSIYSDNKRLSSIELALETRQSQQNTENDDLNQSNTSNTSSNLEEKNEKDAIDLIVAELQNSTVLEDLSAEEVLEKKNQLNLEDGIRAYYDGNYNKSFELLYPLAEEGISRAQFRSGVMYKYGRSVAKN